MLLIALFNFARISIWEHILKASTCSIWPCNKNSTFSYFTLDSHFCLCHLVSLGSADCELMMSVLSLSVIQVSCLSCNVF